MFPPLTIHLVACEGFPGKPCTPRFLPADTSLTAAVYVVVKKVVLRDFWSPSILLAAIRSLVRYPIDTVPLLMDPVNRILKSV